MSLGPLLWPAALVATGLMFGGDGNQESVTGPDVYPQFAKDKPCQRWPSCHNDTGGDSSGGWELDFTGALDSADGLSADALVLVDNKFKFTAEAGRDGNPHHLSSIPAADPLDDECVVPPHIRARKPSLEMSYYLTAYRHGTAVVLYNEREAENVFRILGKADIGEGGAVDWRGVWRYLWGTATRDNNTILAGMNTRGGYFHSDGTPLIMDSTYHVLATDFMHGSDNLRYKQYDPTPFPTGIIYSEPLLVYLEALATSPDNPPDPFLDHEPRRWGGAAQSPNQLGPAEVLQPTWARIRSRTSVLNRISILLQQSPKAGV